MVSTTVDVGARKNLAQISQVLTQIASGSEFSEECPQFIPINEMVSKTVAEMTVWMLQSERPTRFVNVSLRLYQQVADVPDAETRYHAHEFLDATVQPKPIYISPNEVYGMHALLSKYQDKLVGLTIFMTIRS